MVFLKFLGHLFFIILLTLITQIGGVIWLACIILSKKYKSKKRYTFPLLYLAFNLLIVPLIAKPFGRVPLPVFSEQVKPINWFYPLAFRNYVKPELKYLLESTSKESEFTITYLDANFPFFDGFPLLPHLSHNDGKKVDIAFMYKTKDGKLTDKKPSTSGYGFYVNTNENQTALQCERQGYWQYDITKYLTFGGNKELMFDSKNTKRLIISILEPSKTQKLFIEPYLKQDMGLHNYNKIRFHGCQAVRHDDHIHLQIK